MVCKAFHTLGDVEYRIRQEVFGQMIAYVYQQALEKNTQEDFAKIQASCLKS